MIYRHLNRSVAGLRVLCSLSRINGHRLRHGLLSDEEWQRLAIARQKMERANLFIDDTAANVEAARACGLRAVLHDPAQGAAGITEALWLHGVDVR